MSNNYLSMSDEEIQDSNSPDDLATSEQQPVDNTSNVEQATQEVTSQEQEQVEPQVEDYDPPDEDYSDDPEAEDSQWESSNEGGDIDYKGVYEKIFKPFKANGKEITIDDPDDVVSLMQMGANYNKKMAALKPSMNIIKMLEKQDLLDEEKISYLIDISKHNPQALGKLLKESQLDAYDIESASDGEDYVPTSYNEPDVDTHLQDVFDSIKDTPTFAETMDTVLKEWDSVSQSTIYENPDIIRVINDHKQNGIYDIISTEMEKQRVLGKLDGLSDIEAYRNIGNYIYDQGGFNHITPTQHSGSYGNPTVSNYGSDPTRLNEDLRYKRRAIAPIKQSGKGVATSGKDYLAMSDEAFERQFAQQYM